MKLKLDLLDHNLEVKETMEIESEYYPYEFKIVRVQLRDKENPENIRHNETKLFQLN